MDWLKQLLGDDLFAQVTAKLGDVKLIKDDGMMIPKARFDEVTEQRKAFQTQVAERDKQLADLQKAVKDNAQLTAQIEALQAENKKTTAEYDAKLQATRLDYAIERALVAADAKNAKAVRALLDLNVVKLDGEQLLGVNDQIERLKASDAYLFGAGLQGRTPNLTQTPPPPQDNPWKPGPTFNLTKQGEVLRRDPEQAKRLMEQAKP